MQQNGYMLTRIHFCACLALNNCFPLQQNTATFLSQVLLPCCTSKTLSTFSCLYCVVSYGNLWHVYFVLFSDHSFHSYPNRVVLTITPPLGFKLESGDYRATAQSTRPPTTCCCFFFVVPLVIEQINFFINETRMA